MPEAEVLADLLTRPAAAHKGIVYLQTGDRRTEVSYAQLLQRASRLSAYFADQGLRPGDHLVLFVRDNRAFVDAFWACQLGGFVAVPLAGGVQSENLRKLRQVAGLLESPWLFSGRDLYLRSRQDSGDDTLFAERVCLLEDIGPLQKQGIVYTASPDTPALVQFSSGSTGEAKGVQLTHANLLANIRAISKAAEIGPDDACLSWMPLSHDMGLVGFHLVPLANGIDQVLMDTERFVRRPVQWLECAQAERSTLLCSPNFGYQHCLKALDGQRPGLDLRHVRLIFNGAEPISAAVSRHFLEHLADCGLRAATMFPVYGLAEASLAVTFPRPGSGLETLQVDPQALAESKAVVVDAAAEQAKELVCLGWPVDQCELRICDAEGEPLAEGHIGHVQVRGANVTQGYYRCPDCDRAAFVDGWLDSGDLGLMTSRGLVITGRSREVIFVDGQNWYPQDIEYALQLGGDLEPGKVAVTALRSEDNAEDAVLVFIQYRRPLESFAEQLPAWHAALTAATGLHAQAIIPVHSLPRTSSGKLQRYKLAAAYAAGEFALSLADLARQPAPAAGDDNPVEEQLLEICRQLFPGHRLQTDQNLFELGADSLMLVRIHEEIEARYPGRVAVTDLFDHPTIRALAAHIQAWSA